MFSCSPGVKRRPKATEINLAANSSALAPPGVSPGAECRNAGSLTTEKAEGIQAHVLHEKNKIFFADIPRHHNRF
jgi:hypothetical protein